MAGMTLARVIVTVTAVVWATSAAKQPAHELVDMPNAGTMRHSSIGQCHHASNHCFWGWPHDWWKACGECGHHCAAIAADVSGTTADAVGKKLSQCCLDHRKDGGDRGKTNAGASCRGYYDWMDSNKMVQPVPAQQSMRFPTHDENCRHNNTAAERAYCEIAQVVGRLLTLVTTQRERVADRALPSHLGGRQLPPPAPATDFITAVLEVIVEGDRTTVLADTIVHQRTDQGRAIWQAWNVNQRATVEYWLTRINQVEAVLDDAPASDKDKAQRVMATLRDNYAVPEAAALVVMAILLDN